MSFSNWYHNKLNEEQVDMTSSLDDEAPVQQQQMPADKAAAPAAGGNFRQYLTDTNLKASLQKLGKDIGDAIYNFAVKEYVNDDMFDSEDEKIKYVNAIRNKVAETYNINLIELMKNIGIFIENTRVSATK